MVRELVKAAIAVAAGIVVGYGASDYIAQWQSGLPPIVTASPAGRAPLASGDASPQGSSPSTAQPADTAASMPAVDLASQLLDIKRQVAAQAELLQRQAKLLDELTGVQRSSAESALADCQAVQQRLEKQLEGCLFAKASLERSLASAKAETPEPRGSVVVEEHVERPAAPLPGGSPTTDPTGSD